MAEGLPECGELLRADILFVWAAQREWGHILQLEFDRRVTRTTEELGLHDGGAERRRSSQPMPEPYRRSPGAMLGDLRSVHDEGGCSVDPHLLGVCGGRDLAPSCRLF